jgi:hypothetical protein
MLDKIYSDDERESYEAGYDCAVNGANIKNSHFYFFGTHERTKAWEQGNANGKIETNSP